MINADEFTPEQREAVSVLMEYVERFGPVFGAVSNLVNAAAEESGFLQGHDVAPEWQERIPLVAAAMKYLEVEANRITEWVLNEETDPE